MKPTPSLWSSASAPTASLAFAWRHLDFAHASGLFGVIFSIATPSTVGRTGSHAIAAKSAATSMTYSRICTQKGGQC